MKTELYISSTRPEDMSAALWELSRPASMRKADEVTRMLFPTHEDPKGGKWLVVDPERVVNIHPKADLGAIADLLQPLIDTKQLPPDTLTNLRLLVDATRGDLIMLYRDAFPPEIKAQAKTREQMIDEGLIIEPNILL